MHSGARAATANKELNQASQKSFFSFFSWSVSDNIVLPAKNKVYCWRHKKFPALSIVGKASIEDKIRQIFKKIAANQKAVKLIEEILEKYQTFQISFESSLNNKNLQFGGYINTRKKIICVNENMSEMFTLATIIFELCNGLNPRLTNNLNPNDYLKIKDGKEKYAKDVEKAEFLSISRAQEVYKEGVEKLKYPVPLATKIGLSLFSESYLTAMMDCLPVALELVLGRYFLKINETQYLQLEEKKPYIFWGRSHTDFYREQWERANSVAMQKNRKRHLIDNDMPRKKQKLTEQNR